MTNQSKVAPVEAQAVPDQPVAIRYLDRNGRWRFLKYPFTYSWEFPTSLGTPEFLFTRPTPAAVVWTEEAATRTAHAAGFAGTHWIMGPEELAHLLSVAASPAAAAGVPTGWKLVEDFHVGDYVIFNGVEHVIYALGDKPGTFDIMLPSRTGDRWRNVPPSALKYGLGTALLAASPVAPVGAPTRLTDEQRDHSVHLVVNDGGEDFRQGRALSDAASSAEGQWKPLPEGGGILPPFPKEAADAPCGHMKRGVRKSHCARCMRAAYPSLSFAEAQRAFITDNAPATGAADESAEAPTARMLSKDEAMDAYADVEWPEDQPPPSFMGRLNAVIRKFCEVNGIALLSRPGCELATDATKQPQPHIPKVPQ